MLGPIAGTRETVERLFTPELVGKDPRPVERRFDDCYDLGRRAYQSVVPLPALSGIDMALWDLAGTLADVPVSQLLGGARRQAVRGYATGHYFRHGVDLETQYESIAAEARENADGRVPVPDGPGLGVDLDSEALERYRVD